VSVFGQLYVHCPICPLKQTVYQHLCQMPMFTNVAAYFNTSPPDTERDVSYCVAVVIVSRDDPRSARIHRDDMSYTVRLIRHVRTITMRNGAYPRPKLFNFSTRQLDKCAVLPFCPYLCPSVCPPSPSSTLASAVLPQKCDTIVAKFTFLELLVVSNAVGSNIFRTSDSNNDISIVQICLGL